MICLKNCSFQRIAVRKLQSKNLRCLDRLLPLNFLLRTAPYSKPIRLFKEEECSYSWLIQIQWYCYIPWEITPSAFFRSSRYEKRTQRLIYLRLRFIPLSVPSTRPVVDNCAQLAASTMKDPKWSLRTLVVMKKLPEKSRKEL
jgi:hypothetical protein